MNSWVTEKKFFEEIAKKSDKSIKLQTKDNWFCRFLSWALFIVTLGKSKRIVFMTEFSTAIGNYIFFPKEWGSEQVIRVMYHEFRHVQQNRILGLNIHPMCGLPLMTILYLFIPLPVCGALCRLLFEWDADMYQADKQLNMGCDNWDFIKANFQYRPMVLSSSAYCWTVPKRLSIFLYQYGLNCLKVKVKK